MKKFIAAAALCWLAIFAQAQSNFTAIGGGYSVANLNQPQFSDFIAAVNQANPGLTSPFTTDDLFKGFNLFMAFKNKKSLFTLGFARLANKYRAEGAVPVVSSNAGTYTLGSKHNYFSMQLDFFPVRILGLGGELGYSYSIFKNEQKDLIFGETNAVVDKKGGFYGGLNLILHIPLGSKAFVQLQPYVQRAFYKNDMDNLARIYLGTGNSAAAETKLSATGVHAKLGITIN